MASRITIYHVAERAGVSISTVSLVMNAPSRVAPATRARVLRAADDLGFEPKTEAVARARRGVGRIGVLAPLSSYPSYGRRLNGVLRTVRGRATEVVVYDLESAATSSSPLLSSLPLTGRLDGLIIMGLPLEPAVAARLRDQRLPTVLVDTEHEGFDTVSIDDQAGGRLVAEHMLVAGYEHFAFFGEAQTSHRYISPAELRLSGFRQVITAAGRRLPRASVRLVEHRRDAADQAAVELLRGLRRPTAVFAHDDALAASLVRAARHLNIHIPSELGVAGFDDSDLAAALDLTTVRQPLEQSGRDAVRMLLERIEGPDGHTSDLRLRLTLVPRASTGLNSKDLR
jgi:LacI family transcriptional regulator